MGSISTFFVMCWLVSNMDRGFEGGLTHPLAIAPTNTAIECVSGKVGRNCDNRIVGASAERANEQGLSLITVGY